MEVTPERGRELLGKPDINIAGLQIWVHSREEDDWLIVTMHCGRDNSDVWIKNQSSLNVHYDLEPLITELENLLNHLKDKVVFEFTEPYLALEFEVNNPQSQTSNELEMTIRITPNQLFQNHEYKFGITRRETESFLNDLKELVSQ
ncbi:MAG: hypothetical protein ABIH70_03420 [Chloroflexota bacterium]